MIDLRPDTTPGAQPGDLDEVFADNASVHLEKRSETDRPRRR